MLDGFCIINFNEDTKGFSRIGRESRGNISLDGHNGEIKINLLGRLMDLSLTEERSNFFVMMLGTFDFVRARSSLDSKSGLIQFLSRRYVKAVWGFVSRTTRSRLLQHCLIESA